MHELTRRILEVYRDRRNADKSLFFDDPFVLIQIGLKTRDIPEAGDLHFVKQCIREAMGLWSQENKITSVFN